MFTSGPGNRSVGDPKIISKVDNTLCRGMPGRCLFGSRPGVLSRRAPSGGGRARARGEREKARAKVRTARHKVCRLLCEALAAVGARTGVGTHFPLRLLAQTSALWRGPICEVGNVGHPIYNSICLLRGQEIGPPGTPRQPQRWTTLYGEGCPDDAFSARGAGEGEG